MSFSRNQDPARRDLITSRIYTGLRPGEICALKWKHINLFQRRVLIRETRQTNGSERLPKTQSSYREIDLPNREIDLNEAAPEAFKRGEKRPQLVGRYVFLQPNRAPWTLNRLQKKFTPLLIRAGLLYRSVNELLHTFAAPTLSLGENVTWVSDEAGAWRQDRNIVAIRRHSHGTS